MRSIALLSSLTLLHRLALADAAAQDNILPFFAPSLQSPHQLFPVLLKRQSSCPSNHVSCSSLSAPNACCPSNTVCARDSAGNVACCPVNYTCTGVISGTASRTSSTTGTSTSGASNTGVIIGGTVTVTSTAGVTATATTAATAPVTITAGSTVANNYYPFPYIQTTYQNSAACLSAYTFCQQQSTSCFNTLAGANGVTVSNALGSGGTTQQGAAGLVQTSASSICSSLSVTACYGLQSTQCSQFGAGTATSSGGIVQVGANAGSRATACPGAGMRYAAAVGVLGVGMAL